MSKIHPYLPNSVPEIKEKMMEKIGINSIDDLFSDIPKEFLYKKQLDIPGTHSEIEVRKHVSGLIEETMAPLRPNSSGRGGSPGRVLDQLYTIPARDKPRNIAGGLRVPEPSM